jgi:hypothetical protein
VCAILAAEKSYNVVEFHNFFHLYPCSRMVHRYSKVDMGGEDVTGRMGVPGLITGTIVEPMEKQVRGYVGKFSQRY